MLGDGRALVRVREAPFFVVARASEPSERLSEADVTRLLILVVGGVAGFVAVLVSLALVYQWWDTFAGGLAFAIGIQNSVQIGSQRDLRSLFSTISSR